MISQTPRPDHFRKLSMEKQNFFLRIEVWENVVAFIKKEELCRLMGSST